MISQTVGIHKEIIWFPAASASAYRGLGGIFLNSALKSRFIRLPWTVSVIWKHPCSFPRRV